MRNNNANQRVAREIADDRGLIGSGYDARAREIRAENARRAAAALRATPERETGRLDWLMRDVCSTPYAEVRA